MSDEQPNIQWDGKKFNVSLPIEDNSVVEAEFIPGLVYVLRIQEDGADEWSPGFETPFNSARFSGLKPDTRYKVMLTSKNEVGESEPTYSHVKTEPDSDSVDVIPSPDSGIW